MEVTGLVITEVTGLLITEVTGLVIMEVITDLAITEVITGLVIIGTERLITVGTMDGTQDLGGTAITEDDGNFPSSYSSYLIVP